MKPTEEIVNQINKALDSVCNEFGLSVQDLYLTYSESLGNTITYDIRLKSNNICISKIHIGITINNII